MKTLSELLVQGHDSVLATLRELGRSPLLFVGPEGVGRRRVARWLAGFLNCQAEPRERPCLECDSCRRFDSVHPDYREISPKTTTGTGRQSRKQEIVIGQLVPRPNFDDPLSRWLEQRPAFQQRVGVIDGAHNLTVAAANSFLKMLEEPPSYARIVLIAPSPQAVLSTIASRCITLRFAPVDTAGLGLVGHPAHRLGRPGPLLEPRDKAEQVAAEVDRFVEFLDADLEAALAASDALAERWQEGGWGEELVEMLRERFRQLLPPVARAGADDLLLECEEAISGYAPAPLALRVLMLELRALPNRLG
ncbi:MAG: hypothetical protein WD273_13075 [Trueperaceae bacterium]